MEATNSLMDNDGLPFRLEPQEELLLNARPLFLSFFTFYLPSLYAIVLSVFFLIRRDTTGSENIESLLTRLDIAGEHWLFYGLIIIPAIAYSFLRLNLRYVIFAVLLIGSSLYLKYNVFNDFKIAVTDASVSSWLRDRVELIIFFFSGLLGVFITELYRRSHQYVVTNARILTRAGLLSKKERTLPLSKINDISIHRGFLGMLFGFGTLIPITASGIGMGSDFAAFAGSVSKKWFGLPTIGVALAGGHSIQIPKTRTHEALFGIVKPNETREEIMRVLVARELRLSQVEG